MTRARFVPMPHELATRAFHFGTNGPCNDPGCRGCDPMRAELRAHGEKVMRREVNRRARRERAGLPN